VDSWRALEGLAQIGSTKVVFFSLTVFWKGSWAKAMMFQTVPNYARMSL